MQHKPVLNYYDLHKPKLDIDYQSIYTSCFPIIRSMVLKNNGTIDDARDVFQESILILFQNSTKEQFELRVATCTYLYSIARNKWLRNVRTFDRRTSIEQLDNTPAEIALQDNDEQKQRQRLLLKHLGNIGAKCERMLQLFFEGVPGEQIATELEFSSYEYYRVAKTRCIDNLKKLIQQDPMFKELIH